MDHRQEHDDLGSGEACPATVIPTVPRGSPVEVFRAFLMLGLTSFGGPVAHLGYFRTEFVERRAWLDDKSYSDLVALCQFLPGPASSQVGLALGLRRAGWLGALAAWLGFTLPSAVALILVALGMGSSSLLWNSGVIHGLKIAAVAIVAQAVWAMSRTLCPDRPRRVIAVAAALVAVAMPTAWGQLGAIVAGGLAGRWVNQDRTPTPTISCAYGISKRLGAALLLAAGSLLVLLPLLADALRSPALAVVAAFYRSGALVFGGGHVVLPLLQASVVPQGLVSSDAFLSGYGVAQAVPGPLFTFAAYLGTVMTGPLGGWSGGMLLLVAIFTPAILLVGGALPFWETLGQRGEVRRAMASVNAAVVGILAAALYDPVWPGAIHSWLDFGVAAGAFCLLVLARRSPALVVALTAGVAWVLAR